MSDTPAETNTPAPTEETQTSALTEETSISDPPEDDAPTLTATSTATETETASVSWADRCSGILWAQLVADASALGVHWEYNSENIPEDPTFLDPKANETVKKYHGKRKPGQFTLYGDSQFLSLKSIVQAKGFDVKHFGMASYDAYTPSFGNWNGYIDHATAQTINNFVEFKKRKKGKPKDYKWQSGATDSQMISVATIGPFLAWYFWVHQDAFEKQEETKFLTNLCNATNTFVGFRQKSSDSRLGAHYTAVLTYHLLKGLDSKTSVKKAYDHLKDKFSNFWNNTFTDLFSLFDSGKDVSTVTSKFGKPCNLNSSLPGSIYSYVHGSGGSFEDCISAILKAGGENAGRACTVAIWYGAEKGTNSIPEEWKLKLKDQKKIEKLAISLLKLPQITYDPEKHDPPPPKASTSRKRPNVKLTLAKADEVELSESTPDSAPKPALTE